MRESPNIDTSIETIGCVLLCPRMKKVILQILFLSCFLLLSSCQKVSAVDQLKVATFNTQRGTPTGGCDQEANPKREAKIRPLAQYIKDKQYDVILLQEMILFADSDCYYDEVMELAKQLTNIGYQMDYATIPESLRTDHMRVATFSRFPIQHNATTYIVDLPSEPARTFLVTPITTPLGKVNFYNAHVRHREPQQCPGVNKLLNALVSDPTPLKLVGADFNLAFNDVNKCNVPLDSFNFIVKVKSAIDYLMTPKNSNIEFLNSYIDGGSPTSDHKAVVSIIGSTLPATPTPSPSPSTPAQKTGDVDGDSDVDIFDYNLLLSNFNRTGASGFSTADIIKNGSIDIFDYNALLANFGK